MSQRKKEEQKNSSPQRSKTTMDALAAARESSQGRYDATRQPLQPLNEASAGGADFWTGIVAAKDAVLALMQSQGLTAAQLDKLVIELPDDRCQLVNNRNMPNINVQHLVALTLIDGGLNFESSHQHERMSDPAVLAVKAKIDLQANAALTTALPPRQVIMTAHTLDGRVLRHHAKAVRGTPDDPMTRAEVMEKAEDLMAPILGQARATELTRLVMGLDEVADAGAVLGPLLAAD
jgi:2-methylcitrate dehydratase PrpD